MERPTVMYSCSFTKMIKKKIYEKLYLNSFPIKVAAENTGKLISLT